MKNSIQLIIGSLLFLYLQSVLAVVLSMYQGHILLDLINISPLAISSLMLFVVVILLITYKQQYYFILLPFVLIAFPNIINDLFPSFYMGALNEKGIATFSIVTHIDLFLIFGVAIFWKNLDKNKKLNSYIRLYMYTIIIFYLLSLISTSLTWTDFYLLTIGNYLIRYSLLIILLCILVEFSDEVKKKIIYGLGLSLIFLILESIAYTDIYNLDRLTSGTLGVNVYGNVVAALTLFFIFLHTNSIKQMILRSIVIIIGVTIVLFSETRMALLSFYSVFSLVLFLSIRKNSINNHRFETILFLVISPIILVFILSNERYINTVNVIGHIDSVRMSSSASSMNTRRLLFATSANMIIDHPVLGVGPGRWNYYKDEYGFPLKVLIDPHNDYLSYWSIYGVLTGSILIGFILIFPAFFFLKERLARSTENMIWGIIPFTLMVSGLTNANTLKHQVTAFAIFLSVLIFQIKGKEE